MAYQLFMDFDEMAKEDLKGCVMVQSQSSKKVFYKVDLDNETCSCPAFAFSKRDPKNCKHLLGMGLLGKQSPTKPVGILGEDYL